MRNTILSLGSLLISTLIGFGVTALIYHFTGSTKIGDPLFMIFAVGATILAMIVVVPFAIFKWGK